MTADAGGRPVDDINFDQRFISEGHSFNYDNTLQSPKIAKLIPGMLIIVFVSGVLKLCTFSITYAETF